MKNSKKGRNVAIFVCLTPYHVYVSYLYSMYLFNRYKLKSRYLIWGVFNTKDIDKFNADFIDIFYIERHEKTLFDLIKKRLFYSGYLFHFSKIGNLLEKKEHILLFVFNDLDSITYKVMRLTKKYDNQSKICVVDEGLAIYTDTKDTLNLSFKFRIREFVLKYLFGSPSHYKAIGDDERVDFAIVGNPDVYKKLRKSVGKIVLAQKKEALFSYDYTSKFVKNFFHTELKPIFCDIVFLGQNFSGKGYITEQERALLEEISTIFNLIGKTIIKPHPSDDIHKYDRIIEKQNNFLLINPEFNKIPMECLFGYFNCRYIVTISSSVALNIASCFPAMKVIFLTNYKLKNSDRIPFKELFEKHNPLHEPQFFSALDNMNNVLVPKNAVELEEFLQISNKQTNVAQTDTILQFDEIDKVLHYFDCD